jgi:hypothetical protein
MKEHRILPDGSTLTLTVVPWPDVVIDSLGHDPRSRYVETYWLAVLGPSTTWLLRRLAFRLEAEPGGFSLDLAETARSLGLGAKGGRHSPFVRALGRCVAFDLARPESYDSLAVRRRLPPLSRRQVLHLPRSLQQSHQRWQDAQLGPPGAEHQVRRSRQLALSLRQLGEDPEAVERQLRRWRFPPALAKGSAAWAWAQPAPVNGRRGAGGEAPRTATPAR